MPRFNTMRRVQHSAQAMFELVADVERYPLFVPLCQSLRVRKRMETGEDLTTLIADMTVAYKVIRETFTSRVTLNRTHQRILVEYLDGPFSRLENNWTFTPVTAEVCDVGFFIDYEFKSRALGLLMGAMFDTAFHKFAAAFERRADLIYASARSA